MNKVAGAPLAGQSKHAEPDGLIHGSAIKSQRKWPQMSNIRNSNRR